VTPSSRTRPTWYTHGRCWSTCPAEVTSRDGPEIRREG
jgi:hypothetical protein